MRNQETGLEYANTDPSLHCNTIDPAGPDWRDDYLTLLKDRDFEGAHELRKRHDPKYKEETEPAVTVLKTEHTPLKSCAQVAAEQEESEAA